MTDWRLQYAQVQRLLGESELRLGVGVLALGAACTALVLASFPAQAPSTVASIVASGSASFAGAYLSYAAIARHLVSTERQRIATPTAVCERYAGRLDLLTPSRVAAVGDHGGPDTLPVVVAQAADDRTGLDWAETVSDDVYDLPPSLAGFLEPRLDALTERFEMEGKFNDRKARLDAADPSRLHVSETTYFRTFCTNFSPDLTGPNGGPGLRDVYDGDLVDDDGLVPLSDSPFSNHLGGGGVVVTADGHAVLGVRTADVTVGERRVGNSFGGNFEYETMAAGATCEDELLREAGEELLELDAADVRDTVVLGLLRRVDWLGKPDLTSLVFTDALDGHDPTAEEFYRGVSVDLEPDRIDAVETLFDPDTAMACVGAILDRIDASTAEPSVNVLVTLELWLRAAGER